MSGPPLHYRPSPNRQRALIPLDHHDELQGMLDSLKQAVKERMCPLEKELTFALLHNQEDIVGILNDLKQRHDVGVH